MTVLISLTQGQTAMVDDEDGDLATLAWYAHKDPRSLTYYAVRNIQRDDGSRTSQYLHSVVVKRVGIEGEVDHKDRDGLNNKRFNMRAATRSQNNANQGLRKNNTSGTKGVTWVKRIGRWQAKLQVNGKERHIGYFYDLALAAAVKSARDAGFGEFACHE